MKRTCKMNKEHNRPWNQDRFIEHTLKNGRVVIRCKDCIESSKSKLIVKRLEAEKEKESLNDNYIVRKLIRGTTLKKGDIPNDNSN